MNTKNRFGGDELGGGRRGKCTAQTHRALKKAAHTGARSLISPPRLGQSSLRGWRGEHNRAAVMAVRSIERHVRRGFGVYASIALEAARWKRKRYRCDPSRKHHFSRPTLIRLYYKWISDGRRPAALALHYWSGPRDSFRGSELIRLCLVSEARTLKGAYSRLRRPTGSFWSYRAALPATTRARIMELLFARRTVDRLTRLAQQRLNRAERSLSA
jgi:hypothetical protein